MQTHTIEQLLRTLKFNADGLIPAIAQSAADGSVLMLAWMNAESIRKTLETGDVWYYSRSRSAFWRKGETSGHTQKLVECYVDCDGDTLLLRVQQIGPACHTNRPNCFFTRVDDATLTIMQEPQE